MEHLQILMLKHTFQSKYQQFDQGIKQIKNYYDMKKPIFNKKAMYIIPAINNCLVHQL